MTEGPRLFINPDTVATKVARRQTPSASGLPKKQFAIVGLGFDGREYIQLGVPGQLHALAATNLLPGTLEDKQSTAARAFRLKDDLVPSHLLLEEQTSMTIDNVRGMFREGQRFAEGPFSVPSQPGSSPIADIEKMTVWAPVELALEDQWVIEDL